ncbi:MAG: hypothetical protein HKN76_07690, partial [Saprospiraceae bacterium]|nr:hypothetical protein [Saprospiraceae bacterium]
MRIFTLSLLSIFILSCSQQVATDQPDDALGTLMHEFSINKNAAEEFEKGLLLLHSFEYDDAREAFDLAIAADSTEMMSYWGKTMTYYKALWGLQDIDAGRSVMQQLGPNKEVRLSHAGDELEKDFWTGLELLFGEGEFKERNKEYSTHLGKLYDKYPGNGEVAAFYALSLLWSDTPDGDNKTELLSAKIADGILKENPNHPGAVHYKIHALDNPALAIEAQFAADLYAKIAPDATHALHMPSHIYLALGRWDDVVSSNEASYAASIKRIERKNLGPAARGYHSYAWLHYGYLQQGRYDLAASLLTDMYKFADETPNASARSYLIGMQNAQIIECPDWNLETGPRLEIDVEDLNISSQAAHSFLCGMNAANDDDKDALVAEIESLKAKIAVASLLVGEDGSAMCSAGTTRYAPNKNTILMAETILSQLQALSAGLIQDDQSCEAALILATTKESETEYGSGPPSVALPSFEQYGYW